MRIETYVYHIIIVMNIGSILVAIDAQISGLNRGLSQAGSAVSRFSSATIADLKRVDAAFSALGTVVAATGAATGAFLLYAGNEAAKAESQFNLLRTTSKKLGVDFDALSTILDQVAGNFGLSGRAAREAASTLLRNGASAEQIGALLQSAGASAILVGMDVERAWNNVAVAVVSGRSVLLETSGIITNLGPVYQKYASSLGKTVDELTQEERVTAGVLAIVSETRPEVELMSEATSTLSIASARLRDSLQEVTIAIGEQVVPRLVELIAISNQLVDVWGSLPQETQQNIVSMGELATASGLAAAGFVALRPIVGTVVGVFSSLGKTAINLVKNPLTALIGVLVSAGEGFFSVTSPTINWMDLLYRLGGVISGVVQVVYGLVQVIGVLANAIGRVLGVAFSSLVESIQQGAGLISVSSSWGDSILAMIDRVYQALVPFTESLGKLFSGDVLGASKGFAQGFAELPQIIKEGFSSAFDPAKDATTSFIQDALINPFSNFGERLDFDSLTDALDSAGENIANGGAAINIAFDSSVAAPLATKVTELSTTFTNKFDQIKSVLSTIDFGVTYEETDKVAQSAKVLNYDLGSLPQGAGEAEAALEGVKEEARETKSAFEELQESINRMGETLPSAISSLGKTLQESGKGGLEFQEVLSGIEEKSKTGTSALDEYDRKILEVIRSVQSGDITPLQGEELTKQLREMQTETAKIAESEGDREDNNRKILELQQKQSQKTQQNQQEVNQLRSQEGNFLKEITGLLGSVNAQYKESEKNEKGRNKQLSESGKSLEDQLDKIEQMKEQYSKLASLDPMGARKLSPYIKQLDEAKDKLETMSREAKKSSGGVRPAIEVVYIPGGPQTYAPLQNALKDVAKQGLSIGLKEGAEGGDWEKSLRDSLMESIQSAIIDGFTESILKTSQLSGITDQLTSLLSSSLQESLDRISGVDRAASNRIARQRIRDIGFIVPEGTQDGVIAPGNRPDFSLPGRNLSLNTPWGNPPLKTPGRNPPMSSVQEFLTQGGTIDIVGRTVFAPLAGGDPINAIDEYMDLLVSAMDATMEELSPLFESLNTEIVDDLQQKMSSTLTQGISSAISSAMGVAFNGEDWRKSLKESIYSSVLQGFALSLNDRLLDQYSGKIARITNSLINGTSTSINNAFNQLNSLLGDLDNDLSSVFAQLDSIGESVFNRFEDTLNSIMDSGLTAGITSFLEGNNTWKDDMSEAFRESILQGMVEAIVQKGIVEGMLSGVLTEINSAVSTGNYDLAATLVEQFMGETLPQVEGVLGDILSPLFGILPPPEDLNTVAANSDTPYQLTGPQYDDPGIISDSSDKQMQAGNTFYDAAQLFEQSVNSMITSQNNPQGNNFSSAVDKFGEIVNKMERVSNDNDVRVTPNSSLV